METIGMLMEYPHYVIFEWDVFSNIRAVCAFVVTELDQEYY